MSHLFHRHLRQHYAVAVAADGPYLIDAQGKRYLDGSGGAAVSCLGHGHPAVIAAVREQVGKLEYAQGIGNSNTLFLAHDRLGTAPDFA